MKRTVLIFICLLVIWQLTTTYIFSDKNLPSSLALINEFLKSVKEGQIINDMFYSIKRVLIGYLIACFIGIFLGLFSAYFEKIGSFIKPVVELLRPIPPIAWIPLSIIFFGLGDNSSYFIVFLSSFFPIFTNTYFGASSLPQSYKNIARTFEISVWDYFTKVLFKYSLPYIFTGLKIGIGMAWMSVIASELVSAQSGLGYFIQINRLLLNIDRIIIGMLLIGIIGLIFNKFISVLEKRIVIWK